MAKKKVAVIGSGLAGLAAVKTALEHGFDVICFEKREKIGGLFFVQENQPDFLHLQSRLYFGLVQNTSKHFTCYSDFPLPKSTPYIMTPDRAHQYLTAYALQHSLLARIQLNRRVVDCSQTSDYDEHGKWQITSEDADDDENKTTEQFDAVIVATGNFTKQRIPTYPGQDEFQKTIVHAGDLYKLDQFAGKSVCIAGGSFTAVDLAVLLATVAKKVHIVTKRGIWVRPLLIEGRSWEFLALNRSLHTLKSPSGFKRFMEGKISDRYDHEQLGLCPKDPYAGAAISNNIDEFIAGGKIKILHGEVDRFTHQSVVVSGDRELVVDSFIWATGYDPDMPFLNAPALFPATKNITEYPHWLYLLPGGQKHATLFTCGIVFSSSALWPVAESQARVICDIIDGAITPPSQPEIEQWFRNEKATVMTTSDKYPAMIDAYYALLELAEVGGFYPSLWKIALKSPSLAYKCFFGGLIPAQFRLCGKGANFAKARRTIEYVYAHDTLLARCDEGFHPKRNRKEGYFKNVLFTSLAVITLTGLLFKRDTVLSLFQSTSTNSA